MRGNEGIIKKILLLAILLAFPGCTKVVYLTEEKEVKVTEYVTKKDTVFVPKIEIEKVEVVKPITDTSRLETSFAYSEAWVSGEKLEHTLFNKPNAFKFDFKVPTTHRDSIVTIREPYPVEVIKEVKKIPNAYRIAFWFVIFEIVAFFVYLWLKIKA